MPRNASLSPIPRSEEILRYWFAQPEPMAFWFGGDAKTDLDIRDRFEQDVKRAVIGEYDEWSFQPRSCLALILLLDQFSLNIYRDLPRSFLQASMALPFALEAIRKGFDQQVAPIERVFYYLPLEHAEDIHLQRQSLALYEQLVRDAPLADKKKMDVFRDYAARHLRVIKRFGRFPDRNEILFRDSTPEESHYLDIEGGPDF